MKNECKIEGLEAKLQDHMLKEYKIEFCATDRFEQLEKHLIKFLE